MRLLILLTAVAIPGSSAATGAPAPAPERQAATPVGMTPPCSDDATVHRAESPRRSVVKTLGEEPPADLALTVVREVDGCHRPVIVRHDIGGSEAEPRPAPAVQRPRARLLPAF